MLLLCALNFVCAALEELPLHAINKDESSEGVRRLQLALVRVGLLWPSKIRYRIGLYGDNTAMAVGESSHSPLAETHTVRQQYGAAGCEAVAVRRHMFE